MAERTCSFPGCPLPLYRLDLCVGHYKRVLRHGDPGTTQIRTVRFGWAAYDRVVDRLALRPSTSPLFEWCSEFTGYCNGDGYGRLRTVGDRWGYAHRVVWEHHNGPIPADMEVMHRCDNPPCCDIDHLELGTHLDNVRQMDARGRRAR